MLNIEMMFGGIGGFDLPHHMSKNRRNKRGFFADERAERLYLSCVYFNQGNNVISFFHCVHD